MKITGLLFALPLVSLSFRPAPAVVLVNEAMVNEPSDSVRLEWIELYNDGAALVNLTFFQLQTGATGLPLQGSLSGNAYAIICRDSTLFVQRWQTDTLAVPPVIIPKSLALTNTSGTIQLFRVGSLESELSWNTSGGDGISWERESPSASPAKQSVDPSGSTPGRINSVARRPNDLALLSVLPTVEQAGTRLQFVIGNPGLNQVTGAFLSIYRVTGLPGTDSLLATLVVPPTDTGFTTIVQTVLALPSYYVSLRAELSGDDVPGNNMLSFTAPGRLFPPIVINEFIANPQAPLSSEWIELYNRSDTSISIGSWFIGDALGINRISTASLLLLPGTFLILSENPADFQSFYTSFTGVVVDPLGWRSLNNDGDVVRLIDSFNIEADRFVYSSVFDSNYSWSRTSDAQAAKWGQSTETGGTPGQPNRLAVRPSGDRTVIRISPRVFSPDGDGIDDEAIIAVEAPPADDYTLKIYDRNGRVVRSLVDHQQGLPFPPEFHWDGRTDSGRRLPIGIYIVYFEAGGVESTKLTIVIAR